MDIIIYLAALCVLLIGAYLVFRVVVRNDYLKRGKLGWIAVSLETLIFALHANLSYMFIPARWPGLPIDRISAPLEVTGGILFAAGILLTGAAMISLGYSRSFGQGSKMVWEKGFYRFSRNPQLIFFGIALLGIALIWPSWLSLGWFAAYLAISQMMVRSEEEFLKKMHGEAYENYCKKVPRYLFF